VNVISDLDYGTIQVNQQNISSNGILEYIPQQNVSTMVHFYNIGGPDILPLTWFNQSDSGNWSDTPPRLTFNVGTIQLNQVYQATFQMKVLSPGNINIFGPNSGITFYNSSGILQSISVPSTYITSIAAMNTTTIQNVTRTLQLSDMNVTMNGTIASVYGTISILPYSSNLTAYANIYVSDEDTGTITFVKTVEINPITNTLIHLTDIDMSQFERGKKYSILVDLVNEAPGAATIPRAQFGNAYLGIQSKKYIILQ
jgi:hypothetical protein